MIERLSPSSILSFCKKYKEWHSQYIMGIPISGIYLTAGSAVHTILEEFFKEPPKGAQIRDFASDRLNVLWTREVLNNSEFQAFLSEPDAPFTADELFQWLYRYLLVWVEETERIERTKGTELAFRFNTPEWVEYEIFDKDLKVKGIIDAVISTDKFNVKSKTATFMLVDYKTSSKSRMTLPTDYYIQLMIYALLFIRDGKKIDWVAVDYLKYNQKYIFRVTEEGLQKTQNLIESVWCEMNYLNEKLKNGENILDYKPATRLVNFL